MDPTIEDNYGFPTEEQTISNKEEEDEVELKQASIQEQSGKSKTKVFISKNRE